MGSQNRTIRVPVDNCPECVSAEAVTIAAVMDIEKSITVTMNQCPCGHKWSTSWDLRGDE